MFDIGWTELLVLAAVAILVVGPKELPRMLRTVGQYAGKMRRMANDFRSQFDEAIRESEFEDMRNTVESVRKIDPLKGVRDSVTKGLDPTKPGAGKAPGKSSESKSGPSKSSESKSAEKPKAEGGDQPQADTHEPRKTEEAVAEASGSEPGRSEPAPAASRTDKRAPRTAEAQGNGGAGSGG